MKMKIGTRSAESENFKIQREKWKIPVAAG